MKQNEASEPAMPFVRSESQEWC